MIHRYAKLDAWKQYQRERCKQYAERVAKAKEKQLSQTAPLTAESLFAAKMAKRHGK